MINKLTHKKMEDTYIASKDGKGYIFDIRRPSTIKNSEIYEQDVKASYDNLNTRTGLGNRVIRRVNFIKPEIKPRTVQPGKASTPLKSLETMIKEGLKIKYEEADPWDLDWIKAKENLITKLKTGEPNITDAEIEIYLIKYPPLNRPQRTRPVTRNPFDESNQPIKAQLKNIGASIGKVSDEVAKNTAEANTRADKQLSASEVLQEWLNIQLTQVQRMLGDNITDTDKGKDMLALKLDQIVKELSIQQVISNQLLMSTVTQLHIDPKDITYVALSEGKTSTNKISIMVLMALYGLTLDSIVSYYDKNNLEHKNVTVNEMFYRMSKDKNVILVNDKDNDRIYFKSVPMTSIAITAEEQSQYTETLRTVGYMPEDMTTDVSTDVPTGVPTVVPTGVEEEKYPDTKRKHTVEIINIITKALEIIAKTQYKSFYDEYNELWSDDVYKRVLQINVDYKLEPFDTGVFTTQNIDGEEKKEPIIGYNQTNPDFLKITLLTGANSEPYKAEQNLFQPFYKSGDKYAYFLWNSKFGAKQFNLGATTQWKQLVTFIDDKLVEYYKKETEKYRDEANINALNASISASEATTAKESTVKSIERAKEVSKINKDYTEARSKYDEKIKNKKNDVTNKQNDVSNKQKSQEDYLLNSTITNISNIENTLDKMQHDDLNPYYNTLNTDQEEYSNDSSIIIMQYIDGKFVLNHFENIMDYQDAGNKYGTFMLSKPLDVDSAFVHDIENNTTTVYYAILINPSFGKADGFVANLNANLSAKGSGMRKKNKSLIYKNSMKSKKCDGTCPVIKGKGKENPWLTHVKKFRASHPDIKYSDVLKQAKATYKK